MLFFTDRYSLLFFSKRNWNGRPRFIMIQTGRLSLSLWPGLIDIAPQILSDCCCDPPLYILGLYIT